MRTLQASKLMHGASQVYQEISEQQERDQLVLDHLEYVRQILGKLAARLPRHADVENLKAAGTLGLIEAAGQFDADRGVPFKTFAYPRIRGAILDELRRNCPLPQSMLQQIAAVRHAYETLQPPVAIEDIAQATRLSLPEVEACLSAIRLTQPEPWNDLLSSIQIVVAHSSGPVETAIQNELQQVLADGIEQLPHQQRIVVTLYYHEDLRLREIAAVMNLSESRVSRLLSQAEFQLKEYVRTRT